MMELSRELFDRQWQPRFGAANPERMSMAFWEWMIRGSETGNPRPYDPEDDAPTGFSPYEVRSHLNLPYDGYSPIWNFQRMGATRTELPDGRTICIAGEHEDFYDPDFYIYNDVVIFHPDGEIGIFGYPEEVFPPTDFHSATLVGERIIVIGRVGYQEKRLQGPTSVFALSLSDYRIEQIRTHGDHPGWIFKHEARLEADGMIIVRGGELLEKKNGEEEIRRNFDDYALDLGSATWTRLTHRNWWQFSIRDGEGRRYFAGVRANLDKLALINAQAAEFLGSLVYVSFEDLFGKHTAPDADADEDRNRARIEVEGVPISVALDGDTIEIVIERQLEKDHAFRLAENLRARIEAATRRPCILTQS